MILRGHCLCGAVGFSSEGPVNWVAHCHCESCRRATASPMTTFVSVPDSTLEWRGTPAARVSSPGVTRGFCAACGSPLFYRTVELPDETHLFAALLDDPEAVVPEQHDFLDARLSWMHPIPETRTPR